MSETLAVSLLREYQSLITALVATGLASDQNGPAYREHAGGKVIEAGSRLQSGAWLKKRPYAQVHAEQAAGRMYAARMLDGALVQLAYTFENDELTGSRLAFLPSPDLLEFQSNADLYAEESVYADVLDPRVVTVPLRFDFDTHAAVPVVHPAAHLTLGQYEGCRIPASAPLAPLLFGDFLVRSFYSSTLSDYESVVVTGLRFPRTMTVAEGKFIHIGVP